MKEYTAEDIQSASNSLPTRGTESNASVRSRECTPPTSPNSFQSLDLKQAEWFFELIPDREMKADVLMELDEGGERKKLLEGMDPEQIGHFIDLLLIPMTPLYLIQELDEEDREEVIHNIEDVNRPATSWTCCSTTRTLPAV